MRYKHLTILILLTTILSLSTTALDEIEIWDEWGRTNAGTNEMTFSEGYQSTTNFTETTFATDGTNYQPLVNSFDLTDNTTPYITVQSASFLWLLDDELSTIEQHTLAWIGQPAALIVSDMNNDTFKSGESYIIGHNNVTMSILGFNGSDFVTYWENDFNTTNNLSFDTNGIKCATWLSDSTERCFIKYHRHNGSDLGHRINGGLLTIIMTVAPNASVSHVTQDFTDLNNSIITIPTIADMNNDAILDIGMWSDFDQDGDYGFSVFEAALSRLLYADNIVTINQAGMTDSYGFNNPIIYDLNGGQKEIFFMHSWASSGTGGIARLYCYDVSAAACAGFPVTIATDPPRTAGSDNAAHSNLVIANANSTEAVCGYGQTKTTGSVGEGTDHVTVFCVDGDGDYDVRMLCGASWGAGGSAVACQAAGGWGVAENKKMTMADFNNDNNDDVILNRVGGQDAVLILDIFTDATPADYLFNFSSDDYEWGIITDIDQDNFIDVILSDAGAMKVFSSIGTNEPPTITADYGRSLGNPLCINTTLRFTGLEDSNYEQPFDEAFDEERIASDCGTGGSIDNGTFHLNTPVFDCYYNETGMFFADVYIQDEFNRDDYTQFRTVTVQVINGQAGVTCSIASSGTDPGESPAPTAQEDQTNQAIEDSFGILFGTGSQSDALKLVVGLSIVIAIVIWAAQQGVSNGMALLGIGLLTTVMVTFIGLLTPAILLLVIMAFVLFMLFQRFIGAGAAEGGG